MLRVFPSLADVPISHCWSGNVAITRDGLPHIGVSGNVYHAMGYNGSGVARASHAGHQVALQMLGRLLDYLLERRHQKVVIMGATSGDTGSAAIQGCKRCSNIDIFILHPHQRVSEFQRRQMTTVLENNVYNINTVNLLLR